MKVEVYTDGSYTTAKPGQTVGAAIVLFEGTPVFAQRYVCKKLEDVSMRNVGGELQAAAMGILTAAKLVDEFGNTGDFDLHIYYDYRGIYEFVKEYKPWQAKKAGAVKYVQVFNYIKQKYPKAKVHFHKVEAHTGVEWNEAVDSLANGIIPKSCEKCVVPDVEL